jgi:hypothetical protein
MPKVRLNLDQLPADADADRVGKLPGFDAPNSISTLRGLYTVLYPQHSGTAHPSFRSIHPVVVDISTAHARVVLEAPYDGRGPFGMAPVRTRLRCSSRPRRLDGPPLTVCML